MFVRISNTPRDYEWGAGQRISELLGTPPIGTPEAELWLGAHPASPAIIDHPEHEHLDAWISADTKAALGHLTQLPYLLKVLAAGSPLSLQVHPSRERAAKRFAEEDAAGIPRDADIRTYRDPNHKPEMIVALEDGFEALCGVRPLAEREAIVSELGIGDYVDARDLGSTIADLLTNRDTGRVARLVEQVVARAAAQTGSVYADSYRWAERLNRHYPGDPGVVISMFLNLAVLKAGEALYLPAGNLHAYLSGLGIEVMAASDNVLRGGLTPKHIDVPELLAVADIEALPMPWVAPEQHGDAAYYRGGAGEFELVFVTGEAIVELTGPAVVLNLSGADAELAGDRTEATLDHGHALFVTLDEQRLSVRGERVVIAQPQAGFVETPA